MSKKKKDPSSSYGSELMAYQPPVNVDLADLLDDSSLQETSIGNFFLFLFTGCFF